MCKNEIKNIRESKKSIWEQRLTLHTSIRQDTNLVLIELSKDKKIPFKRVLEVLIKESPTFKKKMQQLKEEGFFDY